ncbi:uncharacterized protein LOC134311751 isoform X2 [Trichomycterus rosablanca]|uniref:uncharacterized protein LOC134311751 isoform X2 n=1 Tax=Trichomycterus rosablanca TaxID=2290929 RepID=UPI002F35C669
MNCLRSWWSRLRRRSSDRSDPATPENQTESNEPKKREKKWSMKKLKRIFRKKRKEEGEGKLQEEVKEGEDPQRSGDNGDVVEPLVVPEESSWKNSDAGGLEISDHVGDDKKMISQHQGEAVKVMTCSEAEYKDNEDLMEFMNRTSDSISWCDGENQMLHEMNEAGAEALNELMKLHLGRNEKDEARALEEQMKADMDGPEDKIVELLELRESEAETEAETEALAELTNTNMSKNVEDSQAEPEALEEQMKADVDGIEENIVELLELRESEAETEAETEALAELTNTNMSKNVEDSQAEPEALEEQMKADVDGIEENIVELLELRESEAETEALAELTNTNVSENVKDPQVEPEELEDLIHTDMDKQEKSTEDLQTFNNIEFEGRTQTQFTQTLMEREISANQMLEVMEGQPESKAGADFTYVLQNESENADERVQGEKNDPGNNTVDPTKKKKKIRRGTRGRGRKINYKKEKKQGSEITTMVEAEAEATVEIMNIRSDETDSHDEPLGNQVMKEKDGEEETETITQVTKCQLEELMLRSEGQPLDVKVEESMVKVEDDETDCEALEGHDGIEVINNQPLEEKEMLNMLDLEVEVAEIPKNVHLHETEANINQPPAGNEVLNVMDAQARAELTNQQVEKKRLEMMIKQLLKIEVETRDEAPVEAAEKQKLRCFEAPRMMNLVPPAGNEVLNVMDAQARAEHSNQQVENKRLEMKIKQLLKIEVETRAEAPVEAAEEQKFGCSKALRMMNLVPQPMQRKKIRRGTRGQGRKINYKKENKQEMRAGGPEDQTKTSEATCWRAGHAGTELLRNSRTGVKYHTGLEEIKSW